MHLHPLVALKLARGLPGKENVYLNARNILMINLAVSLKEHLQHRHVPQNARLQRAEASAHEAVRNTGETQIAVVSVHPDVSRLPRKENVCLNVKSIKVSFHLINTNLVFLVFLDFCYGKISIQNILYWNQF